MEKNKNRNFLIDETRSEHVFESALLGRVNEKNLYVISDEIKQELLDAPKYIKKKSNKKIFLETSLLSQNKKKDLLLMLEYTSILSENKIYFRLSLIEQEYIAHGQTINQLVTGIAHAVYDNNKESVQECFKEFHIYAKPKGDGSELKNRKYEKDTISETTVEYNSQIGVMGEQDFEIVYNNALAKLLIFLNEEKNPYNQKILEEFERGVAIHKSFFKDKLVNGNPTNKALFGILNNAIEKIEMTEKDETARARLNMAKMDALSTFKDDIKNIEEKHQHELLSGLNADEKSVYSNAIGIMKKTESMPNMTLIDLKGTYDNSKTIDDYIKEIVEQEKADQKTNQPTPIVEEKLEKPNMEKTSEEVKNDTHSNPVEQKATPEQQTQTNYTNSSNSTDDYSSDTDFSDVSDKNVNNQSKVEKEETPQSKVENPENDEERNENPDEERINTGVQPKNENPKKTDREQFDNESEEEL